MLTGFFSTAPTGITTNGNGRVSRAWYNDHARLFSLGDQMELFPSLEQDEQQYKLATEYWLRLWDRLGEPGWESPYYSNSFLDGNPIFSACNKAEKRAIRIIQYSQAHFNTLEWTEEEKKATVGMDLSIAYWWDTFGKDDPEFDIKELVIDCLLTKENAPVIERMIRDWVKKRVNYGEEVDTTPTAW